MITFTGVVTDLTIVPMLAVVIYLLMQRWKIYQPTTRVFFLIYVVFLILRVCNTFSEPSTLWNNGEMLIQVFIMFPLCVVISRVMKTGDPFQIAKTVYELRQQIVERDRTYEELMNSDEGARELQRMRQHVNQLDVKCNKLDKRLRKLLSQRRDGA